MRDHTPPVTIAYNWKTFTLPSGFFTSLSVLHNITFIGQTYTKCRITIDRGAIFHRWQFQQIIQRCVPKTKFPFQNILFPYAFVEIVQISYLREHEYCKRKTAELCKCVLCLILSRFVMLFVNLTKNIPVVFYKMNSEMSDTQKTE